MKELETSQKITFSYHELSTYAPEVFVCGKMIYCKLDICEVFCLHALIKFVSSSSFAQKSDLQKHIPIVSAWTQKAFSNKNFAKIDFQKVDPKKDMLYQFMKKENAHECRVKFTLKSQLTIHVSSVHEEKSPTNVPYVLPIF